jgi:undecaprenyl-diphosphatase
MGVEVPPTRFDVRLSEAIADRTRPCPEAVAQVVTWGADEHVMCALALAWWVYVRAADKPLRKQSNHVLLVATVVTVLPHVMKSFINQERPNRSIRKGRRHGVPLSGKRLDAFPSGHAMHVGAMMSAATALPLPQRLAVWLTGIGLASTRVLLLAHWLSDVLAGLAIGATIERCARSITGYPRMRSRRRRRM